MTFHRFVDEQAKEFGSFETFGEGSTWSWWPCYSGCLPDGDRVGPFASEQDAIDDALPDQCYVDTTD